MWVAGKKQKRAFTAWQGPTSVILIFIPHIEYHLESKNDPILGSVLVCTYCIWVLLSQWVRAIPHQRSFTRLHGSVRNTQGVCELWGLWEWARGRRKKECRGFTSFLCWTRGNGRDLIISGKVLALIKWAAALLITLSIILTLTIFLWLYRAK